MEQHDVAGYLVAVVGVLYSVVLGFLVGTVWTAFAAAQETTNMEAGYVADAFGFAARWETPKRAELLREIARYAVVVDAVELPPSGGDRSDPRAPRFLTHAIDLALFAPAPRVSSPSVVLQNSAIRTELVQNFAQRRRFAPAAHRSVAGPPACRPARSARLGRDHGDGIRVSVWYEERRSADGDDRTHGGLDRLVLWARARVEHALFGVNPRLGRRMDVRDWEQPPGRSREVALSAGRAAVLRGSRWYCRTRPRSTPRRRCGR